MKLISKKRLSQLLLALLFLSFINEFIPGGGVRLAYDYTRYHYKGSSTTTTSFEEFAFALAPDCSPLPNGELPCLLQISPTGANEPCADDDCLTLAITFYKTDYGWMKYLPLIKPVVGKLGLKGKWSMPSPKDDGSYLTGNTSRVVEISSIDIGVSSATLSERAILKLQIERLKAEVQKRVSKQLAKLD